MSESEYDSADSPVAFGALETEETDESQVNVHDVREHAGHEDEKANVSEETKSKEERGEGSEREDVLSEEATSESDGEGQQVAEATTDGDAVSVETERNQPNKGKTNNNGTFT